MTLKLTVDATCPKHRYHPSAGRGAVKQGCRWCNELFDLWTRAETLARDVRLFNDAKAEWKAAIAAKN